MNCVWIAPVRHEVFAWTNIVMESARLHEQTIMKLELKYKTFLPRKCIWKRLLQHFVQYLYYIYDRSLVQERRNSIADALDLRFSYINPSIWPLCDAWLLLVVIVLNIRTLYRINLSEHTETERWSEWRICRR